MGPGPDRNRSTMAGMSLTHHGEKLSYALQVHPEGKGFTIVLPRSEVEVKQDGFVFDLVCPSVCGAVVWCQLKKGRRQLFEAFYEAETGKLIDRRTCVARGVKFYVN